MQLAPKWTWILFVVLVAFAVVLTGVYLVLYRTSLLSGDGRITDSGFWSYPRYTVSFPEIQLAPNTRRTYNVRGLPQESMTFALELLDASNDEPLLAQDWTITVRIKDHQQQEVGAVTAPMSEWKAEKSKETTRLWHTSLRDLPFHTRIEYSIEIIVHGSENGVSTITAIPQLSGGGNELPSSKP